MENADSTYQHCGVVQQPIAVEEIAGLFLLLHPQAFHTCAVDGFQSPERTEEPTALAVASCCWDCVSVDRQCPGEGGRNGPFTEGPEG